MNLYFFFTAWCVYVCVYIYIHMCVCACVWCIAMQVSEIKYENLTSDDFNPIAIGSNNKLIHF